MTTANDNNPIDLSWLTPSATGMSRDSSGCFIDTATKWSPELFESTAERYAATRLPLSDGGCYDAGGAYWGQRPAGTYLFCVHSTRSHSDRHYVDATCATKAFDKLKVPAEFRVESQPLFSITSDGDYIDVTDIIKALEHAEFSYELLTGRGNRGYEADAACRAITGHWHLGDRSYANLRAWRKESGMSDDDADDVTEADLRTLLLWKVACDYAELRPLIDDYQDQAEDVFDRWETTVVEFLQAMGDIEDWDAQCGHNFHLFADDRVMFYTSI